VAIAFISFALSDLLGVGGWAITSRGERTNHGSWQQGQGGP